MNRMILIRHGETDWNIEGRWQGQIDVPLNAIGMKQADEIAQSMLGKKIGAIYSSDLMRARQTAEVIGKALGLKVNLDHRLREIHQGDWQGLLISEIQQRYHDEFTKRKKDPLAVAPPGGETARQVQERVLEFIEDISEYYSNMNILVVSHGFAIAMIIAHFKKIPIEQVWDLVPQNGASCELDIE